MSSYILNAMFCFSRREQLRCSDCILAIGCPQHVSPLLPTITVHLVSKTSKGERLDLAGVPCTLKLILRNFYLPRLLDGTRIRTPRTTTSQVATQRDSLVRRTPNIRSEQQMSTHY